jgi:carbohydrate-selective porin OprB
MKTDGSRDPFLITPITYNVSDHAYVVFDENRKEAVEGIQNYLDEIGLIFLGRFGQREYFNTNICIKQSIIACNKINKKSL